MNGPRLPRVVGQYEGQDVIAAKGFFGNYLKYGTTNASLAKRFDPFLVTLEEAIEILKVKIQKDKEKHIKSWEEDRRVKVVIGRWGPCIQSGKKFFKIPAGKEPLELELEECLVIAGIKKAKKGKAEGKGQKAKVETVKPEVAIQKSQVKAKTVVKKYLPKQPKLRIVKAKRKFAGKRK